MKVKVTLDYDWKNAYSTRTSAIVKLSGKGDKVEALKAADREIQGECGSDYVTFCPETVNGESVRETKREFKDVCWTTAACLAYLKLHPETMEFQLDGGME